MAVFFKDKQVWFEVHPDRNGASVAMILDNCRFDAAVLSECRAIYLCVGHFTSKKSAEMLCDKLNAGEITPYAAAIKSMQRYIKWVKNKRGSNLCISRDQLVYFGATASDLAQYDAAEATLREQYGWQQP